MGDLATSETTVVNVTVVVIDVNDEPPQFGQDQYRVGIPENLSNSFLFLLIYRQHLIVET